MSPSRRAVVVFSAVLAILAGAAPSHAQSADWSAQLLVPPYPSPYLAEWERNPQNLTLALTWLGSGLVDYQVEGVVIGATRGELARAVSPLLTAEAGPVTEFLTGEDVLGWDVQVRQSAADQAFRSGVLPEDDYQVCVRVLSATGIQFLETCAPFEVLLPEAPELLYPDDGAGVGIFQPTFQWTPVIVPPDLGLDYRVRIVEVYPNQTPRTAVAANLPLYDDLVGEAPILVYPLDALELRPGRMYAWQVEALDGFGDPLVPGGLLSPVRTFQATETTGFPGWDGDPGTLPAEIPLVPGLATLTDLGALDAERTGEGWRLNGPARLRLDGPFGLLGRVDLQDLEVEAFAGGFSLAEGRVVGRMATPIPVPSALPVQVREITWDPYDGLLATARVELPGGRIVPLDGELRVTLGGLFGTLTSDGGGDPVWAGGADPVELALNELRVTLPGGETYLSGEATLLGGTALCADLTGTVDSNGVWRVDPLCIPEAAVEETVEAPGIRATVQMATGPISVNLVTGSLRYDLEARAGISLVPAGGPCGVSFTARLVDGEPVTATEVDPRCAVMRSRVESDWLALGLSGLSVSGLTYTPGQGFDLDATLTLDPFLHGIPRLGLPILDGVTLNGDGITLPAASLDLAQWGVELAGYGLDVSRVDFPGVNLSWDAWDTADFGALRFTFSGGLALPNVSAASPYCLVAAAPSITGGVVAEDGVTLQVAGEAGATAGCRIPLGPEAALEVDAWAGPMAFDLDRELTLRQGLGVVGRLHLPAPLRCAEGGDEPLALEAALVLLPDGRVSGSTPTPALSCPLPVAGLELRFEDGELVFDGDQAPQRLLLTAAASVTDPSGGGVLGQGTLTVDLVDGSVVSGSVALTGPLELGVPAEEPVFVFRLNGATLDAEGLGVDGRHDLLFPDGAAMGVTFDQVRLALDGSGLTEGRVLFDAAFALDGGIDEQGAVDWAAVTPEAPFTLDSGFRVALPAQVALGPDGLGVEGETTARLVYRDRDLAEMDGEFSSGFLLGMDPLGVTSGWLGLSLEGRRLAWVDDSGFHPDFGVFGTGLLPDRLGLPTESVAYLELRDEAGNLRLQEESVPEGVRLYTLPDQTIPLVIPAMELGSDGAPRAQVAVDIVLGGTLGTDIRSGTVTAVVDPDAEPALDLSRSGVPFRVRRLTFGDPLGTGFRWSIQGDPVFLGDPVPGATGELTLTADGRLSGEVTLLHEATIPLVEGSTALTFRHRSLTASFDALLPAGPYDWSLDADGALTLDLDGSGGLDAAATLQATPLGVAFTSLEVDADMPPVFFDVAAVEMGFGNLSIPTLTHDDGTGWDFALDFDLTLRFPALEGWASGPIPGLRLTPSGLTLPALDLTGLAGSFDLQGFVISPLALRLPQVELDLFGPGGPGADFDWGFQFDLSLALGNDALGRWPELGGMDLTLLGASWGPGGFTGSFEPRILLDPLDLSWAPNGLGFRLGSLGGSLGVLDGLQTVDLRVGGSLVLPEELRCPAQPDPILNLPATSLELFPGGGIGGRLENASLNCPLQLGPVRVALTDADLVFAFVDDVQAVNVFADATLTLPGTAANTTVSASGELGVELLTPRVIQGSIQVDEPFRWDIPGADPFLSFQVNQAVLDGSGFSLDGAGQVMVDGAPTGPAVTFAGLRFNRLGHMVAGSATIAGGVTLDGVLQGGSVDWRVVDPADPLASGDGFRLGLNAAATLDSTGVGLTGSANGQLVFADSAFAALDVAFTDGFTLGVEQVRVAAGRAGFSLNGTEVAYLDARGFFPGDLFGVLPLPARLPLPSEEVAYLELRDPDSGNPLIQTDSDPQGLRLFTAPNQTVALVLPGIPSPQGGATRIPVSFSVVANGSSYAIVSGSVQAVAPADGSLFDLSELGLPLEVTRIAYDSGAPGSPVLDARVRLPASLDGLALQFTDLAVTAQGLSGEAVLGTLDPAAPASGQPLAQATLGPLTVAVDGLRGRFGANPSVTLEGGFSSGFFSDPNGVRPRVDFTATVAGDGTLAVDTDVTTLPGSRLPVGDALLQLMAVGNVPPVGIEASDARFALTFAGVLTLPTLAPDFAVTLHGLSVGTDGVSLPAVDLAAQSQRVALFGAELTLRQTPQGPGLGLSVQDEELLLTMNGDVAFLGQTVTFQGLRVGTRGTLAMASASLTSGPVEIVPGTISLTGLTIQDRKLAAALAVDLPAPFDDAGTQNVQFRVAADGTVDGGGTVVLLDETQGLGGGRTQFGGPVATAHLRYLAVRVDPATSPAGGVEVVGDLYLGNREGNRISLGNRTNTAVDPGLEIGMDGRVRWGNVTLARAFDFDVDILRLNIQNVTAGGAEFNVGLSGLLAVDLPVVSGGVDFTDFRISASLGLDASNASVQGGHLSIGGVVRLGLTDFVYAPEPTTLTGVQTGLLPSGDSPNATAQVTDLAVSSYLSFGGSVSIGKGCGGGSGTCLFSGGVDRFVFYRSAPEDGGLTNLVIRRANLEIPNALAMEADLQYRQIDTSGGFEILLGGSADFRSREVTVVGALEAGGTTEDIRAGLFLISSERIEIIPVVLALTDVGGGFFYRPRPEYCQLVRQYSGVPDLSSGGDSCENVGKFTGFLFAGAAVVTPEVGRARVLLTVSENGLQLDGAMALLSPGNGPLEEARIRGTLNLTVGFREAFAEGAFRMTVDYDPLVTANPSLEFFVYGEDAWGIYGGGDISFLKLINGSADLFVGPPGFYLEGNIGADFDVWILEISADAEVVTWLAGSDWGAYLAVQAYAGIFGGAVSAEANLKGALVSAEGQPPLVYASAQAAGCLFGECIRKNVWAKFENGDVDAGFGSNGTFNRIINRAQGVRTRFENAKNQVQSQILASQLDVDLALSDEELAGVYEAIRAQGVDPVFNNAITEEYAAYPSALKGSSFDTDWWAPERDYYRSYQELVAQVGSPVRTLVTPLETYYARVNAGVADLNDALPATQLALSQSMAEIRELEETVAELPEWDSPVTAASFQAPQATLNPDGTKTLTSGPGFEVDATEAAAMEAELQAEQARVAAYAREVGERIQEIEAGLAYADYLLKSNEVIRPLGFLRRYAEVLQDVGEQYARHGDLLLRQQDWFRAELQRLVTSRATTISAILSRKSTALGQQPNGVDLLDNLIQLRAQNLDELAQGSTLLADYLDADSVRQANPQAFDIAQYRALADTLGMQFWHHVARAGMERADLLAGMAFDSIRAAADLELRQRWVEHANLSGQVDRAFLARAELVGALYDLYTEYNRVYPDIQTVPSASLATLGDPFTQDLTSRIQAFQAGFAIFTRIRELEAELTVPSMDRVVVASKNLGYMAQEVYFWQASHPSGIDEYTYNSILGGNVGLLGSLGMQSNGSATGRINYLLTPGRGTTAQARTLRAGARGGAGYVGYGRASYETRFEGGEGGQETGDVQYWQRTVDTSPPSIPSVRIGSHSPSTSVYWTRDTDRLDSLRWSAYDIQSGIGGYEYAVGWNADTTAVLGWTDAGGRTELTLTGLGLQAGGPPASSEGTEGTGGSGGYDPTDPFFELPDYQLLDPSQLEAQGYRVYVRARNGEGLTGGPGRSAPIRVDLTPPAFPADAVLRPPLRMTTYMVPFYLLGDGSEPSDPILAAAAPVCPAPGSGLFFEPVYRAPEAPAITLELPDAEDVGSGVQRYAWRVGTEPATEYSEGGWNRTTGLPDTLRVTGYPMNYTDSLYVSVVALDGVGLATDPIHYGPFLAPDPTAPVAPYFCLTTGTTPTSMRLRVAYAGEDPESGVVSWDYRIRRPDGSVVRDWPATPDVTDLLNGGTVTTASLPVSDGEQIYAELRVRNARGQTAVSASGPFTLDLTPPPAPYLRGVTATRSGDQVTLSVEYRTPRVSGLTYHWALVDPVTRKARAQGTLPATGFYPETRTVSAGAVPAGTWGFVLVSRTSNGISSPEAAMAVTVR